MGYVVHYRGDSQDVKDIIVGFVRSVVGENGVGAWMVQGLQMRVANALLSDIEQDFVTKSRGGVGRDGIKWPLLKRETIAQRRIGAGDLSAIGIKGAGQPKSRVRGLLTKEQDKQWRRIFAQTKAWLMAKFGMSQGEASTRAAQTAWAKLKAMGAKTKLEVLGGRKVDTLRDTGELLASFSPGVGTQASAADGQIVRLGAGQVTVGTNKKPWHHTTKKAHRRAFWPDDHLPPPWARSIEIAAATGIQEAVAMLIEGQAA